MLDRYGLVCEYLYEDFEESGVSTKIFQLRPNKLDLADVNERKCDTLKAIDRECGDCCFALNRLQWVTLETG
jgi:hypothetical protein